MSIKILQEISTLVTDFTKKNRFLEYSDEGESDLKYLKLIRGIGAKTWSNEEAAIDGIYGKELNDKTFDMLKSRAKERLVNMIFQLDTEKRFKSSYDKAYYKACKNLLAGVILLLQNRQNAGTNHLKLSLKLSQHHYLTDLSVIALRLLRYSSSFSGSLKSFKNYNTQLKSAMQTLDAELRCEELNQELIMEVVRSAGSRDEMAELAGGYYKELKKIVEKHDTYTTRLNMYRVGLRYYESIFDYKNVLQVADECEKYLKAHPHLIQRVRLGEMNLHKLYGSLHLRDYANGSQYAETCFTLFNPGTLNWLIFLEYYFLLCLHTNQNEKAKEVYDQVIHHPSFQVYPAQSKEKWRIFEAFLSYTFVDSKQETKKFNVFRFTNEVPLFSKDKAGYNLSIIIAQIILLLKIGDYNKILDRYEALKTYASRYIRKDKNPRSYYFIKMLLVMVKYDFDQEKTEQIANKFFIKLKESHLGEQSELETLEVIPYDILWPQMVKMLK